MAEAGVSNKLARKQAFFKRFQGYLTTYKQCLIVSANNVGSNQMQQIRMLMRGKGILVMGKNTMMRKAIRQLTTENPKLEGFLPHINGNVGLIFTDSDLDAIRSIVDEQRVPAAAKPGAIAPRDVVIPKGPTELEPSQTAFLQVLGIATKITKSKIEILSDVTVCTKDEKVGSSEAALLQKLKIFPFTYGLEIEQIYDDGTTYGKEVLDLTADDIISKFQKGVQNVAAVSLEIGIPTVASLPHSIINAFKNVLAVSIETEYTFPESEKIKAYLADPSAFAAAAAPAASSGGGGGAAPAAAAAAEESESSSDDGDGFDLFD
jgi:large subunit ribosomal protein LP0